MKLVFLGTAQDGGIPQAGCTCFNCRHFTRQAASIAIIDHQQAVLIDITPDFRAQASYLLHNFDVRITAVYLTHAHWGHYGGLMMLGQEGWNTTEMPIYLTPEFAEFLIRNQPFNKLIDDGNIVLKITREGARTAHGFEFYNLPHRDEFSTTSGVQIYHHRRLIQYFPCFDKLTAATESEIRRADLTILDGTFYSDAEIENRDLSQIPHPRVKDTVSRFQDVAEKIIFTHFNHTNPLVGEAGCEHVELIKAGFRIAEEGEVLEFQ